jgi:hypothetical protein
VYGYAVMHEVGFYFIGCASGTILLRHSVVEECMRTILTRCHSTRQGFEDNLVIQRS